MTGLSSRSVHEWMASEASRALPRLLEDACRHFEDRSFEGFALRLASEFERIFALMHELYGWRWDFSLRLHDLVVAMARSSANLPGWIAKRDVRAADAAWMSSGTSVWAMTYTERFAGTITAVEDKVDYLESLGVTHLHLMPPYAVPGPENDGGYAVSSYRKVRPELGSTDDLTRLAKRLHKRGLGLVLDFVANHTADDHPWARSARRGEAPYDRFYLTFETRDEVDRWLPALRTIFPHRDGDGFTWVPDASGDGRWVWTTFYPYQWDLDYRNPEVLVAMAAELLHVVSLGPAVLRMDATPFLWKREGTNCENLPEAHLILQIFNAVVKVVSPSVRFLSEAIVHPDDVARFVRPDECALGYNPLHMALTWEAIATQDATMLVDAIRHRSRLPGGCQWISYLRSHDDIGWGFADEDAFRLGIDAVGHRRFLSDFYSGVFPGSFAAGELFGHNERTGDSRISGTLASLAGLERALESADVVEIDLAVNRIVAMQTLAFTTVGMPMLYLGDELGTCNDRSYPNEPGHEHDNRWMHRPRLDWARVAEAGRQPDSPSGRILAAVRRLGALRSQIPVFGAGNPEIVETGHRGVIAFVRRGGGMQLLVAVNLTPRDASVVLDCRGADWRTVEDGDVVPLERTMVPYEVVLAVTTSRTDISPGQVG